MSNQEMLNQMMQSAAKNEERVMEYIEKKQAEAMNHTIGIYARSVYDSMNYLAGGDKEKRVELIEMLFNAVRDME